MLKAGNCRHEKRGHGQTLRIEPTPPQKPQNWARTGARALIHAFFLGVDDYSRLSTPKNKAWMVTDALKEGVRRHPRPVFGRGGRGHASTPKKKGVDKYPRLFFARREARTVIHAQLKGVDDC